MEGDRLSVGSEDDIAEDDEFGPCRDLFSAHFDKLASDPKVRQVPNLYILQTSP